VKVGVAVLLAVAALASSSCSEAKRSAAASRECPKSWQAGWQKLADRIQAPVYCPTWMPDPLDGRIGGQWTDIDSVSKRDRSYLISFLYHEPQTGDVHVNFRGYPGRTAIPTCSNTQFVDGKPQYSHLPCFADPHKPVRVNGIDATLYTVNQGADQWHVLYAWHRDGSLYTVSQHVTAPLTYRQVAVDLRRVLRGLVLVEPKNA
jgi:hypothetical protein